jgi:hypothetical protein
MRKRIIGIAFSAKNGEKVAANNFKITLNIIIWPVLDTGKVCLLPVCVCAVYKNLSNEKRGFFFSVEVQFFFFTK